MFVEQHLFLHEFIPANNEWLIPFTERRVYIAYTFRNRFDD
jgi:hypothetical protein